jgi:hypothetical protein
VKTKKFRTETIRTAGKIDDYLETLAAELRSGSHEHSSWVKPCQSFEIDDITVDGVWGNSKVTVTYDAATGSTATEEIRWKKVGTEWWLASPCDEEEEDE